MDPRPGWATLWIPSLPKLWYDSFFKESSQLIVLHQWQYGYSSVNEVQMHWETKAQRAAVFVDLKVSDLGVLTRKQKEVTEFLSAIQFSDNISYIPMG